MSETLHFVLSKWMEESGYHWGCITSVENLIRILLYLPEDIHLNKQRSNIFSFSTKPSALSGIAVIGPYSFNHLNSKGV